MDEHVILVAVQVRASDRHQAMNQIGELLNWHGTPGDNHPFGFVAHWIAEDDRNDGSDCDSAVFCNPGAQAQASQVLYSTIARDRTTGLRIQPVASLTQICNLVTHQVNDQFDGGPV